MIKNRYIGLDYLRAFFSVCIVAIHLGYFAPSNIFKIKLFSTHQFGISDFVNFYILLLGVPMFFIISNFLFYQKPANGKILFKYLLRISKIALFWILLHTIFTNISWNILWLPKTFNDMMHFIFSGRYTVYYFFISLIFLTIITHFVKYLNIRQIVTLFLISTILITLLPLFSIWTDYFIPTVYYHPINYFPYPFAAALVYHIAKAKTIKLKPIFLISVIIFIILLIIFEWTFYVNEGFFGVNRFAFPAYSRPSLVIMATVILFIAIKVKPKQNSVILFMSINSLALYCIHPFFTPIIGKFTGNLFIFSLILTVIISYIAAYIARKFIKKDLL